MFKLKRIIVLISFIQYFGLGAQNLVPNPSFETYTTCPTGGGQINYAVPWVGQTSSATTDYFNACAVPGLSVPYAAHGFQYAKNGNSMAGFWLYTPLSSNSREYAQVMLIDTLSLNKCYYVEYFVNLGNQSRWAINNVAANFSKIQYTTTGTGALLNLPQHITNNPNARIKDTLNWTKVSGMYVAGGGEKYLTIGNFKDDANTDTVQVSSVGANYGAVYFLDAVSIFSINPTGILPWTYNDASVALGDSVYIGNTMGGTFTSNWYTYSGSFINSGSGIYVKPVTTSTYVVQFTVCGVPRSDTLTVTVTGVGIDELRIKSEELRIMPNPNSGVFEVEILTSELRIKDEELRVTNVLGQEIKREKLLSKIQKINLEEFESGIYYLHIVSKGTTVSTKKIIKL